MSKYLGAGEAAQLVGAYRQLGSDVSFLTPGRPAHHHHHGGGRERGDRWHGPQQYGNPGYRPPAPLGGGYGGYNGYNGYNGYQPPRVPTRNPNAYVPQTQASAPGLPTRDHRTVNLADHIASGDPMALLGAMAEQYAELQGGGPSPRAWLREMAPPDMANRQVLPMNTGTTPVPQNSTAQITSRPQRVAFRPERVFVSATGPLGAGGQVPSAADWIVNDITIGNRSQFAQSGALPGDMFSSVAIDSFVTFETAQTAMDVVMIVTYQGAVEGGTPFYGSIVGTAAV